MIKNKKLIFIITYIAYTAIYIARVNLSIAGPGLRELEIINEAQLGFLAGIFSTVYSVGRLLNGGLSDKKAPWVMLTTGLLVSSAANIFIGFLPPYIGIFLLWTTNAYAQSMLWSSVLCVVSALYEKKEAKKKTSLMVTSVAMGNILGIIINTFFISAFGVRFAFIVPGVLTLVLGFLVCIATKEIKAPAQTAEKKHISIGKLLGDKELLGMIIPAMMHGVMKENVTVWMAIYIFDKFMVDLKDSSFYILLIPVIGFVGRMMYSFVYKICGEKENTVSVIGFAGCIIASILLFVPGIGMSVAVVALGVIYAAASMINTSMLSIYPMRFVKTGNVASVSGIMDFVTYFAAGVASGIYGVVIKNFGYSPMFISWIVISLISIILLWINTKNIND